MSVIVVGLVPRLFLRDCLSSPSVSIWLSSSSFIASSSSLLSLSFLFASSSLSTILNRFDVEAPPILTVDLLDKAFSGTTDGLVSIEEMIIAVVEEDDCVCGIEYDEADDVENKDVDER